MPQEKPPEQVDRGNGKAILSEIEEVGNMSESLFYAVMARPPTGCVSSVVPVSFT